MATAVFSRLVIALETLGSTRDTAKLTSAAIRVASAHSLEATAAVESQKVERSVAISSIQARIRAMEMGLPALPLVQHQGT